VLGRCKGLLPALRAAPAAIGGRVGARGAQRVIGTLVRLVEPRK
jgi:hypothetical protein